MTATDEIKDGRYRGALVFALVALVCAVPGTVHMLYPGSRLGLLILFPVVATGAAWFWGWRLAPRLIGLNELTRDRQTIRVGFGVPLLSLLTTAIVIWLLRRLLGWSDDGLIGTIYAVFVVGLLAIGWIIVPASLAVTMWLQSHFRRRYGHLGTDKLNGGR